MISRYQAELLEMQTTRKSLVTIYLFNGFVSLETGTIFAATNFYKH